MKAIQPIREQESLYKLYNSIYFIKSNFVIPNFGLKIVHGGGGGQYWPKKCFSDIWKVGEMLEIIILKSVPDDLFFHIVL